MTSPGALTPEQRVALEQLLRQEETIIGSHREHGPTWTRHAARADALRAALAVPPSPPADAKEWTCPQCNGDVLWCKCPVPEPPDLSALVLEWQRAYVQAKTAMATGADAMAELTVRLKLLNWTPRSAAPRHRFRSGTC